MRGLGVDFETLDHKVINCSIFTQIRPMGLYKWLHQGLWHLYSSWGQIWDAGGWLSPVPTVGAKNEKRWKGLLYTTYFVNPYLSVVLQSVWRNWLFAQVGSYELLKTIVELVRKKASRVNLSSIPFLPFPCTILYCWRLAPACSFKKFL